MLPLEMSEEDKAALANYWKERIDVFEAVIYPVFHERGYSKNTAFLVSMIDELDDSITTVIALKRG